MSETAKYGAVIAGQLVKRMSPYALAALGGFIAAGWPHLHAAFCQVN